MPARLKRLGERVGQRLWKSLWAVLGRNVADSSEGRRLTTLSRIRSEPRLQTAKQTVKVGGANSALSLCRPNALNHGKRVARPHCRRKAARKRIVYCQKSRPPPTMLGART